MLTGILTGLSWLSTIWFAAHMIDKRARLYWIAGWTAWAEGLEWLAGQVCALVRAFVRSIGQPGLDDWLLAELAWIAFEFHRGRRARRRELLSAFGLAERV